MKTRIVGAIGLAGLAFVAGFAAAPATDQRARIIDEMSECVTCMDAAKRLRKEWEDIFVRTTAEPHLKTANENADKYMGLTNSAYVAAETRYYELCGELAAMKGK